MINRELIRLKVVQLQFARELNPKDDSAVEEDELNFSLNKAYELYLYLLNLLVEVKRHAAARAEAAGSRAQRLGIAPKGELPEARLAANQFLCQLEANEQLTAYREKQKPEWIEEAPFVKTLYTAFTDSEPFRLYLDKGESDYAADRELVRKLYKLLVCRNEAFEALLEDHSLYWNDDKHIVDSFVLKTIKRFTATSDPATPLLPPYDTAEDERFGRLLFIAARERSDETTALLRQHCKNWEFERLALMDVVIMRIALAEILAFPDIPLSVTFNEYLDIAKIYSTPRSSGYINGLLDHIVKDLRRENKLLK